MGGTRCTFRDCKVSSNRNPSMHFFKFPVRDPRQLEKWLQICANEEILKVSHGKLANRAVCARHFRLECFMNYKMDRLIAKQTPTLMRVNKDLAWDFESIDENGEAMLVKLPSPISAHLKPPEGFECPLGFDTDAIEDVISLDRLVNKRPATSLPERAIKRRMVTLRTEQEQEHQISTKIPPRIIDLPRNGLKTQTEEIYKPIISKISSRPIIEEPSFPIEQSLEMTVGEEEDTAVPESDMQTLSTSKECQLQLEYNKLKLEMLKLSEENAHLKQASIPSTSRAQPSSSSTNMTKPQLYNGIKKYLGPTVAALVRMEMFGGAEDRNWKDDERRFAVELLQLGENIYEHCCEEWRFRLPSLRIARSWLNSKESEDVDDSIDF
ncbi:uncharacterized protein LOC121403745 [Drosophila obscura]|uniref:uncharacterized protein LOC121403745 n=1 Tax=Drosophila obscura TaxID=7282 RepID=UPI000BA13CC8|nr:uncharacterized protein LOC121403745 [Drosophila obscura]